MTTRITATMLTAAAKDRLSDHRRADHLVVEDDGEGLADILAGRVAKPSRAGSIELEADDRLVVLEGGLRVGQHVAADHDPLPHHIGALAAAVSPLFLRREDLVPGRQPPAPRLLDGDAGIDQLERQLGGAAQERLDLLRIVDAGELHQDAALPFALDRRLLRAGLIDATTDDFDRLLDCLAPARLGRDRAVFDRAGAVGADIDH
jgi:hypothetical protein